jgi:hypothetical protein
MTRTTPEVATVALIVAGLATATLLAQTTTPVHPGKAGSPHVRTDWTLDGATVSIEYGRPFVKGRTLGKDLEPTPGTIWRLGADEPTTLKTDKPLEIGTTKVAAGSYSLWVMTDQSGGWKLVVSRKVPSWGTMYPGAAADLARIDMKTEKLPKPADQLTLSIESGQLRVDWASVRASVPIKVVVAP